MSIDVSTDVRNEALRRIANGVYVLTTCLGEQIHAATVTWVSQVSFRPPLVLVALQRNSRLAHAVRKAHRFALNLLEADQTPLAQAFFEYTAAPAGGENLAGFSFRYDPAHCPLLTDCAAWLECRLADEPPSPGDHSLMLGEVTGAGLRRQQAAPMVLWGTPWSYGGLAAR